MLTLVELPPFKVWLFNLRDPRARKQVARRLARAQIGHFGDHKGVGGGVSELRIDHGPGYRIYFARKGRKILLLICGGDKGSQDRDIARARSTLADWLMEHEHEDHDL